jgi:hypothetical protein
VGVVSAAAACPGPGEPSFDVERLAGIAQRIETCTLLQRLCPQPCVHLGVDDRPERLAPVRGDVPRPARFAGRVGGQDELTVLV